jgi:hypothetical protein
MCHHVWQHEVNVPVFNQNYVRSIEGIQSRDYLPISSYGVYSCLFCKKEKEVPFYG